MLFNTEPHQPLSEHSHTASESCLLLQEDIVNPAIYANARWFNINVFNNTIPFMDKTDFQKIVFLLPPAPFLLPPETHYHIPTAIPSTLLPSYLSSTSPCPSYPKVFHAPKLPLCPPASHSLY